jgi:hypothetical protein
MTGLFIKLNVLCELKERNVSEFMHLEGLEYEQVLNASAYETLC